MYVIVVKNVSREQLPSSDILARSSTFFCGMMGLLERPKSSEKILNPMFQG
jgi:hypothetical protein